MSDFPNINNIHSISTIASLGSLAELDPNPSVPSLSESSMGTPNHHNNDSKSATPNVMKSENSSNGSTAGHTGSESASGPHSSVIVDEALKIVTDAASLEAKPKRRNSKLSEDPNMVPAGSTEDASETKNICDTCNQSFTRAHNLKAHQLIHLNEKPFICPTCDLPFRRAYDLRRHLKIHSNVKPYVCKNCGKSFSRNDSLTRHMNSHSGCNPMDNTAQILQARTDGSSNTANQSDTLVNTDEQKRFKRRKVDAAQINHAIEQSTGMNYQQHQEISKETTQDMSDSQNAYNNDENNFFVHEAMQNQLNQDEAVELAADGNKNDNPLNGNDTSNRVNEEIEQTSEDTKDTSGKKAAGYAAVTQKLREMSEVPLPMVNLSLISGLVSDILSNSTTSEAGENSRPIALTETQFKVLTDLLAKLHDLDGRVDKLEKILTKISS